MSTDEMKWSDSEAPKPAETSLAEPKRLPVPISAQESGVIVGATFEDQFRIARALCASGLVPKSYDTPEKVFAASQLAYELGLKPMTALRQIAVINGSPSLWGDLPLSLVMRSGNLEAIQEWWTDKDGKSIEDSKAEPFAAHCAVRRRGVGGDTVRSFSMDDARVAGLLNKGTWKQYPKRMLQCRARSWALKDLFPDSLMGLTIAEYDHHVIPDSDGAIETKPKASSVNDVFGKKETQDDLAKVSE